MNYEVNFIQHQSYGDESGTTHEHTVVSVTYTKEDFNSQATFEFPKGTAESVILEKIETHGRSILPQAELKYNFAKTGTIS